MSAFKKYAIVIFNQESQVEVVPSSWLVASNGVKWPANKSLNMVKKLIRECSLPEEDWNTIPVRTLGFANSFKSANQKATLAQDTSNIGTDSSQSEEEGTNRERKRIRPRRYDSTTEEDIDVTNEYKKHKKFPVPNVPSSREMHQYTSRNVDESQESLSVSLISSKNFPQPAPPTQQPIHQPALPIQQKTPEPLPSSRERNTMIALFTRVFRCMDGMQNDLKIIKTEQAKMQCALSEVLNKNDPIQGLFSLPDGIFLPVETDDQLTQMNFCLRENKSLISALARYLYGCSSGKTISSFLLSVTRKILHRSVAILYSRLGRKGKKSFEGVEEVYSAILAAAALKFSEATREDIAERFGRVLASAPDWDRCCRTNKNIELSQSTDWGTLDES